MDEYSDGEIARQEKPIGYFSTLNSTFFSTDEEIKKNFNNLFEKYENGNKLIDKELLEKIYISYSVLEDGESRKGYLHMLEVRYFLSQPNNLENCVSKFGFIFFFYLLLQRNSFFFSKQNFSLYCI